MPSFCYYPGLSLQGACRMCLVKIEKMPKLQTACTTVVGEGMVVTTESEEDQAGAQVDDRDAAGQPSAGLPGVRCGRRVRTAGHDVHLRRRRIEVHGDEEPQGRAAVVSGGVLRSAALHSVLSLRARVRRRHGRVGARACRTAASSSIIAPNKEDHLECEECGMCIDICPVGALTSGAYRYKTRPWEMKHVGTICTHCGDGCKTTLGVRRSDTGMEIVRGDNRDKSGINGDFLCIKGRYAFDFAQSLKSA